MPYNINYHVNSEIHSMQEHTLGNVRIIHAAPDAPNIDVYANNRIIAENLSYSQFTVYTPIPEGTYSISAYVSGTTDCPIVTNMLRIDKNTSTTAAVVGTLSTIGLLAVPDNYKGAPSISNEAEVRLIHLAPNVPAVDVTLPNGVFIFDYVSYKELTEYKSFVPGSNIIQIRLARTPTAILRVPINLQPRLVYTIYFIGMVTEKPGLDALILLDGFFIEVEK